MSLTLAEEFIKSKGAPIDVDGVIVLNMYRKDVVAGQKISIHIDAFRGNPEHGIRIKLQDGFIVVNDQKLKEIVIWINTAPSDFDIVCLPKGKKGELRLWNCWRDTDGVTHAWVGNAGIVVEDDGFGTILHCSSGGGKFNPEDLTVTLQLK